VTPSSSRASAHEALNRIFKNSLSLDEFERRHPELIEHLSESDHGLYREIVLGVCRFLPRIDFFLDRELSKGSISKIEVRNALRMGAYEIFHLRTPTHAAVSESVKLIKNSKFHHLSAFTNAILRKLANRSEEYSKKIWNPYESAEISAAFCLPPWLIDRLIEVFGFQRAFLIAESFLEKPKAVLCSLEGEGSGGVLSERSIFVDRVNSEVLDAVSSGRVIIQSESSQLACAVLGAQPSERVWDTCAAPGGKTILIAEMLQGRGSLISTDRSEKRLLEVQRRGEKAQFFSTVVRCQVLDLEKILDSEEAFSANDPFDRILVDAPCSALGTLAAHPEGKWIKERESLQDFTQRQFLILKSASRSLRAGGILVYSVCSMDPSEGTQVVERFLASPEGRGFARLDLSREFAGKLSSSVFNTRGEIELIPGVNSSDGFFISKLRKR